MRDASHAEQVTESTPPSLLRVWRDLRPEPPLKAAPWWLLAAVEGDEPTGPSRRGSHRLDAVRKCERLWYWRYFRGFRKAANHEPSWRLSGTLIHRVLAEWWASRATLDLRPSWYGRVPLEEVMYASWPGQPSLVRDAIACGAGYARFYAVDEWRPYSIEREYKVTVGELDPGGPDASLDHEVVTCRPDLLAFPRREDNRTLVYVDHKSTRFYDGGAGGLPAWNPRQNEFATSWQFLMNMHVLRRVLPPEYELVAASVQRASRRPGNDGLYRFDRQPLELSSLAYAETPRLIRVAVAAERDLGIRIASDPDHAMEVVIPNFGECNTQFGPCDMMQWCHAGSLGERAVLEATYYDDPARGGAA